MKFRSYSLIVLAASLIGATALADTTAAVNTTAKPAATAPKPEVKQSASAKAQTSAATTTQIEKTGDKKADAKVATHQHSKDKAKSGTAKNDAPTTGIKVSSAAKVDSTVKTK
jgi:hypothetical protein